MRPMWKRGLWIRAGTTLFSTYCSLRGLSYTSLDISLSNLLCQARQKKMSKEEKWTQYSTGKLATHLSIFKESLDRVDMSEFTRIHIYHTNTWQEAPIHSLVKQEHSRCFGMNNLAMVIKLKRVNISAFHSDKWPKDSILTIYLDSNDNEYCYHGQILKYYHLNKETMLRSSHVRTWISQYLNTLYS